MDGFDFKNLLAFLGIAHRGFSKQILKYNDIGTCFNKEVKLCKTNLNFLKQFCWNSILRKLLQKEDL